MQKEIKILVVDDDPDIREAIGAVLEAHSYVVVTACDGEEGLVKLPGIGPKSAQKLLQMIEDTTVTEPDEDNEEDIEESRD